ncbi:MAG: hypothetical protein IKZ71_07645 [Bacteroidales bacterium]|nr:hypothetical protein [Bacteroidales bacterium]
MKKLIIALIPLLTLISCGEPELTPIQEAVKQKVEEQLGKLDYITFNEFELVDSSKFSDEIARRRHTIEVRYKLNDKKAQEYKSKGMLTNAGIKRQAAEKDLQVLEGIKALEQRLAEHDSLDVVELYRYKFSAIARSDGENVTIENMYVAITPDNQVVAMDYKKDGVLKATGSLIPGYREMLAE